MFNEIKRKTLSPSILSPSHFITDGQSVCPSLSSISYTDISSSSSAYLYTTGNLAAHCCSLHNNAFPRLNSEFLVVTFTLYLVHTGKSKYMLCLVTKLQNRINHNVLINPFKIWQSSST